jgi:ATP-dependent RNA helicase SUPV3L1/SUV3
MSFILFQNRINRSFISQLYICSVISSRSYARNRVVKNHRDLARNHKRVKSLDDIVKPIVVPINNKSTNSSLDDFDGSEVVNRDSISAILIDFSKRPSLRELAEDNGISSKLFMKAFLSFRQHCLNVESLDPMLKVTFSDIINHGHSIDTLFTYFLSHARKVYPHLESLEDLKLISDLTQPHNWYPEARNIQRKIIFHAGNLFDFFKTVNYLIISIFKDQQIVEKHMLLWKDLNKLKVEYTLDHFDYLQMKFL